MSQQGGSFSAQTKEELLHTAPAHDGCIRAEMAAVIQACGSLVLTQRGLHLELIFHLPNDRYEIVYTSADPEFLY